MGPVLLSFVTLGATTLVGGAMGAAALAGLYPPTPRDLGGARDLDPDAERVRIDLPGGDHADGWYLPGTGRGDVLLLHGYGRTHHRVWRYAGFLMAAGYGVLAIDFRSSRRVRRLPTTLGRYEEEDAVAALDWLRAAGGGLPLGILGESLGGTVALLAAARRPEVAAVVVDCPFSNGRDAMEDMLGRFLRLPRWPSAPLARTLTRWVTGKDPY
jgi:alpha-beta hydrolase superfamily lysophospholipase